MSIDRGLHKEAVVHIDSEILLRHKKEQTWVETQMDLQSVVQSEISQRLIIFYWSSRAKLGSFVACRKEYQ